MKNQNDLIFTIVAIVLALGVGLGVFFTRPQPVAPAAPTAVNLTPPKLPEGTVVMATALPNAGQASGGAGGPAGFGGGMGRPGMGGPPMGMPGGGPAGLSRGGTSMGGGAPATPSAAGMATGGGR